MRNRILAAGFFLAFVGFVNNALALEIETWQTSQGVKVLFVAAPEIPMVDIELTFDAGSARDLELKNGQPGLASLTASLLNSGISYKKSGKKVSKNEQQISAGFNNLGAQFSASANRDFATLSLRSLTRESLLNPALEQFIELASAANFPAKVFKRDQARLLQALEQQAEQPNYLANLEFWQTLYPNHPYGTPTDGTLESIAALKPKDLQAFFQEFYVLENAQIAMVGALDTARAKQIAEQIAGALPSGKKAKNLPQPDLVAAAEVKKLDFKSAQTHYLLGQIGVERGNPDYYPLFLGNHLLGGSGFGSLLMEEVREKRGLVYGVSSFFAPMKVAGPWLVNLSVENAKAGEADLVVRQTLHDFLQGFSDEALEAIKDNIINGWPMRADSNSKTLGYISMIGFYDLPLTYVDDFPKIIKSLSKQDVLQAWQNLLDENKLINIQVGQFAE